ncbi:MAG: hypothetical protein FWC10_09420 [Lentimicrobiaceae bacterium]|nr:hypothetical protein [Lentimicrobiaceae bacterium]
MKKTLLTLFVAGAVTTIAGAQQNPILTPIRCPVPEKTWNFPAKPGTDEWVALGTREERLRVSQIPDEILRTISTEELVRLCLNFPFRVDFFLHNNRQQGVNKIASEFNGLQELFSRKDNIQYLLVLLENKELETALGDETLNHGRFALEFSLVEIMLAQESVLTNATPEQRANIASIALRNLNVKEQHYQIFGRSGLETTAYLLYANLRSLDSCGDLSPDLELFFNAGGLLFKPELLEKLRQNYTKTINR